MDETDEFIDVHNKLVKFFLLLLAPVSRMYTLDYEGDPKLRLCWPTNSLLRLAHLKFGYSVMLIAGSNVSVSYLVEDLL